MDRTIKTTYVVEVKRNIYQTHRYIVEGEKQSDAIKEAATLFEIELQNNASHWRYDASDVQFKVEKNDKYALETN